MKWRHAAHLLIFTMFMAFSAATSALIAETVTGLVYQDANANGRRDAGETGLEGVVVSDSEQVVRSGRDGGFRFEFKPRGTRFVFVTRPTGMRVTTPWYVRFEAPATLDVAALAQPAVEPVIRYDFRRCEGKTVLDQAGSKQNAEIVSGSASAEGLHLTGPKDMVQVPYGAFPGARGMIRLRVKFDALDVNHTLFRVYSLGDGLVLGNKGSSMRLSYYHRKTGKWYTAAFPMQAIKAQQWHTIAAYWDTQEALMLLLDGQPKANLALNLESDFQKGGVMAVGNTHGAEQAMRGWIESFEMWANVTPQAEQSAASQQRSTVEFGLVADADPNNRPGADFTIMAGGDIQYDMVKNEAELRYDWAAMEQLSKSVPTAFATWAGDLTESGTFPNLKLLQQVQGTLSYPTYNAFGGHDGLEEGRGTKHYEEVFGPWAYSWDYAGRHFVSLVSETIFLAPESVLVPRQQAWLKADLAAQPAGTEVFFVTHWPELIESVFDEAAQKHKVLGVLRGHYHATYFYRSGKDQVPVICSSPIRQVGVGTFTKQPRMIHFSKGKISSTIVVLGQGQRLQVVWPQADATLSAQAQPEILVNAYNSGSRVQRVTCDLTGPGGPVLRDHPLTKQTWWSWRAATDSLRLAPGQYTLTVRATDDQDQSWTRESNFQVTEAAYPAAALGADWVSHYGPDGRSRVVKAEASPELRLLWAAAAGGLDGGSVWYGNPLVHQGVVYAPLRDDNIDAPAGGIAAFDAGTGALRWRKNLGSIHHTPVIVGGQLFALSSPGIVHAIDLATQQVRWTFDLYAGLNYTHRFATTPVAAAGDAVIVGGDGAPFVCLDAQTGKPRWSWKVKRNLHGRVSGAFVDGQTVYIGDESYLYALALADGSLRWEQDLGYRQRVSSTPLVQDGRLYYVQHGRVSAFDVSAAQPKRLWQIGSEMFKYAMPVVDGGRLYYSGQGEIVCTSKEDGRAIWRINTTSAPGGDVGKYQQLVDASTAAVAGGHCFVGSDNGCFYTIDAEKGTIVWKFATGAPIKSSAAISGNVIFVGGTDGMLYALAPGLAATGR